MHSQMNPPCLRLVDNFFYGLSHHENIIEWKNNTHHLYFILEFSKGYKSFIHFKKCVFQKVYFCLFTWYFFKQNCIMLCNIMIRIIWTWTNLMGENAFIITFFM